MFINESEANNRLSSLDNLINRLQVRKTHNGSRPKGAKNQSKEKQAEIAEDAIVLGPTAAADIHGTSISRASLLSKGIVTHGLGTDKELAPVVEDKKQKIHDKALDLILDALNRVNLTDLKGATGLAHITSELAKTAEKTGGRLNKDKEDEKPKVQVIVYAPRMREMGEYETIDV